MTDQWAQPPRAAPRARGGRPGARGLGFDLPYARLLEAEATRDLSHGLRLLVIDPIEERDHVALLLREFGDRPPEDTLAQPGLELAPGRHFFGGGQPAVPLSVGCHSRTALDEAALTTTGGTVSRRPSTVTGNELPFAPSARPTSLGGASDALANAGRRGSAEFQPSPKSRQDSPERFPGWGTPPNGGGPTP